MRRTLVLGLMALLIPTVASAAPVSAADSGWGWLAALASLGVVFALGNLLGSGIVPSGATGTELQAVTRRAFIPKLIVQLYKATPTLAAALSNAQMCSGGVSSVTVPVQGSAMVTAQSTDYSGQFTQPSNLNGISEANYNLKAVVAGIPFLGMEGILQMNAAVIPLIEARMNDAGNAIAAYLSNQLWTNATDLTNDIDGYPLVAATTGTYGNINRTSNAFWRGNARVNAGNPTRQSVMHDIVAATTAAGSQMPSFGVMHPATWALLQDDFLSVEQYHISPNVAFSDPGNSARALFTALSVGGVPIYMDADCPAGEAFYVNTQYDSFYIHEAAAFAFTGFASTLPNFQLGYVGCVVAVLEHINVKPASVLRATGYGSISL